MMDVVGAKSTPSSLGLLLYLLDSNEGKEKLNFNFIL
jgi:hypothetical protein